MAVTGEIQIGRINRFFTKWLGTKGSSPRMSIGGELMGVIPIWSGVENRFLDSWNIYWFLSGPAAGGAGNRSGFRFRNPTGSGIVAVFEKITFNIPNTVASNPQLTIGDATADLGTPSLVTRPVDKRSTTAGASTIGSTSNVGALAALTNPITVWQANTAGDRLFEVIVTDTQEVPLLPGTAIQADAGIDNVALNISWRWRERALEDSEKS
jgi:hypothetical protein